MGFSYSFSFLWRFIICTPVHSGLLVTNLRQSLAPIKSLNRSKRGQDQGDAPKTKINLKISRKISRFQKQKTIYNQVNNIDLGSEQKNLNTSLRPFWVGGFVILSFATSLFSAVPQAHAADYAWNNNDLAKSVIASVTPVVSPNIQEDQTSDQTLVVATNDFIEKPLVVETQITPDPPKIVLASISKRTPADYSLVTGPHYFPYGYCTYYVSQKRTVTWSGNAGTWLNGAKSAGLATGKNPEPGAIMVTSEGGKTGHVAYVEAVNNDTVTVSEMNYKGYGIVSSRTISATSKLIKGFIY